MGRSSIALIVTTALVIVSATTNPAAAQFGKIAKKAREKVEKKADAKADEKVDEAIDNATGDGTAPAEAPPADVDGAATGEPVESVAPTGSVAPEWTLYKKYDFIPGNRVIFLDDLSGEETGEFPARWNLENGVFEVAELGPDKWIASTDDGFITPKLASAPLPERYTAELDFYDHGGNSPGHWISIIWLDAEGKEIGRYKVSDHVNTTLRINDKDIATKALATPLAKGPHTMRIMATKTTLKCYLDSERVANVPQVEGFAPVGFKIHADLWNRELDKYPLLFKGFRFAEGGKTMKEQLDEAGRIVTHGILFESGSATIRPESYKTLADIAALLAADAALRVSIEGHTDADGADAANLALSEARAASVRDYLTANGSGIAKERLEVRGVGETRPIDSNNTPEGKANNRRVELVKL